MGDRPFGFSTGVQSTGSSLRAEGDPTAVPTVSAEDLAALRRLLKSRRSGAVEMHLIVGGEDHQVVMPFSMAADLTDALEALVMGRGVVVADELVSPSAAAEMIGVSRTMVVRWIKDGLLEDRPVGSHHKIPVASVRRVMEQRRRAGQQTEADLQDPQQAGRVEAARERVRALRAARA